MRSNDGSVWKEHKLPCTDEEFRKQYVGEGWSVLNKLDQRTTKNNSK